MISLISHGFGFSGFEGHPFLGFLAHQTEHVPWEGFVYWDLIQPAFMFMVGVAMPFAFAKRVSLGDSHGKIYVHAFRRAFNLVLIAAIFTSTNRGEPTYTLVNVLPQIAFGYLATMLVLQKKLHHTSRHSRGDSHCLHHCLDAVSRQWRRRTLGDGTCQYGRRL